MMSAYDAVKERVNIVEAARYYGIDVRRGNKAVCPFHPDKAPSMSFKNNRYTCFGCGAKGSVIDLVMNLLRVDAKEAAKRLNTDFALGIDISKPLSGAEYRRRNKMKRLYRDFSRWEQRAFIAYADYARQLRGLIDGCDPKTPDEIPDGYGQAVDTLARIDYFLDIFISGTIEQKAAIYQGWRSEVDRIAKTSRIAS